jgi:hypothetical protein
MFTFPTDTPAEHASGNHHYANHQRSAGTMAKTLLAINKQTFFMIAR